MSFFVYLYEYAKLYTELSTYLWITVHNCYIILGVLKNIPFSPFILNADKNGYYYVRQTLKHKFS